MGRTLTRLYDQQDGRCDYCCRKASLRAGSNDPLRATVDHVVAVAAGGSDRLSNKVMACRACNTAKASMSAARYRMVLAANGGLPPMTHAQRWAKLRRQERERARPDFSCLRVSRKDVLPAAGWHVEGKSVGE